MKIGAAIESEERGGASPESPVVPEFPQRTAPTKLHTRRRGTSQIHLFQTRGNEKKKKIRKCLAQ